MACRLRQPPSFLLSPLLKELEVASLSHCFPIHSGPPTGKQLAAGWAPLLARPLCL